MRYDPMSPINAGKPWSVWDDFDLIDQLGHGYTMVQVAEFLQRHEDECRLRQKHLKREKGAASP